jgi:hypothetical protein
VADKNCMWSAAPKPQLKDEFFRPGYGRAKGVQGTAVFAARENAEGTGIMEANSNGYPGSPNANGYPELVEVSLQNDSSVIEQRVQKCEYGSFPWAEPHFDGADTVLCGKDLFMELGHTGNAMGHDWVRRKCRQLGIRFHSLHFPKNVR